MFLKSLYLRNFRSYKTEEFHFHEKMNLIHGSNALGKTNLLEAIYLISTGRSFRTQSLKECIHHQSDSFYLEAELSDQQISHTVKLHFNGTEKLLEMNATRYTTFSPLMSSLPIVLQAPQEEDLIGGSPNIRRRFMNLHLAQSDPIYIHHFIRFNRGMKQRNALLRRSSKEPIELWEAEMAQSAKYIIQARSSLIQNLGPLLLKHTEMIAGKSENYQLRFEPSASSNYLQQLEKNRPKERELGITLTGPHRDDFSFFIQNKLAKLFASEGQKKTATLALKLAEWDHLHQRLNTAPLMAIDEFAATFDSQRLESFKKHLHHLSQIFITSPTSLDNLSFDHRIELEQMLTIVV
jgi:DNA replication and repair protein RecF